MQDFLPSKSAGLLATCAIAAVSCTSASERGARQATRVRASRVPVDNRNPGNLISNGDFESGTEGWLFGRLHRLRVFDQNPQHGAYWLDTVTPCADCASDFGEDSRTLGYAVSETPVAGSSYRATIYFRSTHSPSTQSFGQARLVIWALGGAQPEMAQTAWITGSEQWQQLSVGLTVADSGHQQLLLQVYLQGDAEDIHYQFDDATLAKNLLDNGDFEQGTAHWRFAQINRRVVADATAYRGAQWLDTNMPCPSCPSDFGQAGDTLAYDLLQNLWAGQRYRASIRFRSAPSSTTGEYGEAQLVVWGLGGVLGQDMAQSVWVRGSDQWQQLSVDLDINQTQNTLLRVQVYMRGDGAPFQFDDAWLTGPPRSMPTTGGGGGPTYSGGGGGPEYSGGGGAPENTGGGGGPEAGQPSDDQDVAGEGQDAQGTGEGDGPRSFGGGVPADPDPNNPGGGACDSDCGGEDSGDSTHSDEEALRQWADQLEIDAETLVEVGEQMPETNLMEEGEAALDKIEEARETLGDANNPNAFVEATTALVNANETIYRSQTRLDVSEHSYVHDGRDGTVYRVLGYDEFCHVTSTHMWESIEGEPYNTDGFFWLDADQAAALSLSDTPCNFTPVEVGSASVSDGIVLRYANTGIEGTTYYNGVPIATGVDLFADGWDFEDGRLTSGSLSGIAAGSYAMHFYNPVDGSTVSATLTVP